MTIRAGSNYRGRGGIIIDVVQVISHPNFTDLDYDFAILKLKEYTTEPFNKSFTVKLPEESDQTEFNQTALVSGWGVTEQDMISDELLGVEVAIISDDRCREMLKPLEEYGINFTDRMMCAGDPDGGKKTFLTF